VSLSFLFIPIAALATARIRAEEMGNATSIFNLMRNIGGSVGIAIMTTFLARRSQLQQNHLIEHVTAGNGPAARMLAGMRANFIAHGADAVTATRKAYAALYGMVQQHAAMEAFIEAFWLMGIVFLLMLPFLPLLEYTKHAKAAKAAKKNAGVLRRAELPEATVAPEEAEEHHFAIH